MQQIAALDRRGNRALLHGVLAFVYCEDEPGRRTAAKLLTRDEAHRIASTGFQSPRIAHGSATGVGLRTIAKLAVEFGKY